MCPVTMFVLLQILIIGKSINFLRQSCQDHTQLGGGALRTWYISEEGVCWEGGGGGGGGGRCSEDLVHQ